ncbi:MAG: TonB-dependent receptor [Xanthomonadales bacterium]|mgnify:CR=1 FL=1|nr:TonB-dependent receptor [Xanthomonadales bacterium]
MTRSTRRRLVLANAIFVALSPAAWAAGSADAAASSGTVDATQSTAPGAFDDQVPAGTTDLHQIVVTGTPIALKQIDAGYNINTASREKIQELNPFNAGELLMMVAPGTWSEPTGGKSSGSTTISGYPSTSGASFTTVMVNGSPLWGPAQTSYMDNATLFRMDDTVSGVEVVQGGTGGLYGPGQIGATANFKLRTGTDVPSGSLGVMYGTEGKERIDGFYGFKVADNWYGSVGGFYRISNGIRDTQYKSDQGGQLTATLKHVGEHSNLVLWGRVLSDKNMFLKQVPIIQGADGDFQRYPGFNPLTGIYNGRAIQYTQVPGPYGGLQGVNLANGRGANMRYLGADYEASAGDWSIANHLLYGNGHLPTAALFPGSNPQPLSAYLYGCNMAQPAGYCTADNKPVDKRNLNYPASRVVSATLPNGEVVPLDQSVIQQGMTFNYKQVKTLSNDFRASRDLFEGNTLTVGVYLTRYTMDEVNSSGNQILLLNQPHTLPVALSYTANGQTYIQSNAQGYVDSNKAKVYADSATATNKAFYLSDMWRIGAWTMVAGARIENQNLRQQTCLTSPGDFDGNPLTLYNNKTAICNGGWDREHYDKSHPSFAGSVNYQLTANASVYVNGSTGGHFNDITDLTNAGGDFPPMLKIKDMEAGFRYQSQAWLLDVNVYHRLFDGIQYQQTDANGVAIPGAISTYGSNSHGLNLIAAWSPIENLSLTLAGNYVDGKYSHNDACVPGFDINGDAHCYSFNGNPLARQPKLRYMFTPKYTWPTSFGGITAWVTYTHVGQRYQDQTGIQPLGTYDTFAAGIVTDIGTNWQLRLQGTNLTNEFAITEGNTRVLGQNAGINGVFMARPLFGREVSLQAKYLF